MKINPSIQNLFLFWDNSKFEKYHCYTDNATCHFQSLNRFYHCAFVWEIYFIIDSTKNKFLFLYRFITNDIRIWHFLNIKCSKWSFWCFHLSHYYFATRLAVYGLIYSGILTLSLFSSSYFPLSHSQICKWNTSQLRDYISIELFIRKAGNTLTNME